MKRLKDQTTHKHQFIKFSRETLESPRILVKKGLILRPQPRSMESGFPGDGLESEYFNY